MVRHSGQREEQADGPAAPRAEAPPTPNALLDMQRASGNAAVARWLGGALNADFSDVSIATNSARASAIGARALAEGPTVHFAPGEFRPHDPAGLELIGHELAHVVQQREGRASATHEVAPGTWADRSPALEHEAEEQGRLAARGVPARPGGAFSTPGATRPVVQGAFTAAAELSVANEEEIAADAIRLDSIRMSDKKRPPTRLPGSQGRHTVAWQAKVRFWQEHFKGVTFTEAINRLRALAQGDDAVDAGAGDMGAAGRRARAALLAALPAPGGLRRPATAWIRGLEWALTTYAKAYQQSAFTAFPSVNPKGRNEAGHLKVLGEANASLEGGESPMHWVKARGKRSKRMRKLMSSDAALARARGLLDLSAGAPPLLLHKVFADWLKVLTTLYPKLFQPLRGLPALLRLPNAEQVGLILRNGYDQVHALFDYMREPEVEVPVVEMGEPGDPVPPQPEANAAVPGPEPMDIAAEGLDERDEADDEEQDAGEEDEESAAEEMSAPEEGLRDTEPFVVGVTSSLVDEESGKVAASDVSVKRVVISDERPATRFGNRQMSHTIPWTLARLAWSRGLSGRPLTAVVAELRRRIAADGEWSAAHTPDWIKEQRLQLDDDLAGIHDFPSSIPEWTRWLSRTIERYVEGNQASPFATFGTEAAASGDSTARGRGEPAAMRALQGWEDAIRDGRRLPTVPQVMEHAARLIDIPKVESNRGLVEIGPLKRRWLEDLAAAFPRLLEARGPAFAAAFDREAALAPVAPELLVDSRPRINKRMRD